ncbi:MAG: glycosyltransferase family 4 protein [Planctomycetes bacterium]|uniref:glycosyltransferase family 4 protein n=1 Tax=Candidatus Wunengus sp. YC65 TaxID=3367701 RepID=UPI001DD431EE|nr:glycosyltransferase family 4 protein [Planctomycetota bacterium]
MTKGEGYKIHVLKIIEGLVKKGHRLFLLTINENALLPEFEKYRYLTVKHKYLRLFFHRIFPFTGMINSINILLHILRFYRLHRFDIIHERWGLYSFGGILASRILRIPHLTEINGPGIEEKKLFTKDIAPIQKFTAKMIRKFCLRNTDHVVAVSNNLKSFLLDNHLINRRDKITVLPNAADVTAFNKQFDAQSIKDSLGCEDKFIIAYTGTLQVWYAIEDLILAFPQILKEISNACLLIVGTGQTRKTLEDLAYNLRVSDRVRFMGYVQHEKIPEVLSIADVVVAPYKGVGIPFFNSPIKIFEYLSAGKAIVATKIGQITEVLQDQHTALLVTPSSIEELANAIIRLAHDEQLRSYLAKNAKIEAQKYSWDRYVDHLVDIYRALIV